MDNKIEINGDFTTEKALKWKEKLQKKASNNQLLTVDLTGIEKADIVGVNALVTTHKIMSDKGGILELVVSKKSVLSHLLHLTKFDQLLTIL